MGSVGFELAMQFLARIPHPRPPLAEQPGALFGQRDRLAQGRGVPLQAVDVARHIAGDRHNRLDACLHHGCRTR